MTCRMNELHSKEVINVKDGTRLGYISDVEIDVTNAALKSAVVYGKLRLFGLLGREEDMIIPWRDIVLIGDDTVLVNCEREEQRRQSSLSRFFDRLFL